MAEAKMRQILLILATALLVTGRSLAQEPAGHGRSVEDELRALQLLQLAFPAEDAAARAKIEAAYTRLLDRSPESSPARNAYAAFLFEIGETTRALPMWQDTLRRQPDNAEAAFQLGHATLTHGGTSEALGLLARAAASVEATPFQIHSYANALYLFRHEAPARTSAAALEESLAQFERASRLEPANLDYARGYAETFFALPHPDWERAHQAWTRVVKMTPENDDAIRFHLLQAARSALKANHPAAALNFLDRLPADRPGKVADRLREQAKAALARPTPLHRPVPRVTTEP